MVINTEVFSFQGGGFLSGIEGLHGSYIGTLLLCALGSPKGSSTQDNFHFYIKSSINFLRFSSGD